jgi:hypothetical protein
MAETPASRGESCCCCINFGRNFVIGVYNSTNSEYNSKKGKAPSQTLCEQEGSGAYLSYGKILSFINPKALSNTR